jgi:hypothetical protein
LGVSFLLKKLEDISKMFMDIIVLKGSDKFPIGHPPSQLVYDPQVVASVLRVKAIGINFN